MLSSDFENYLDETIISIDNLKKIEESVSSVIDLCLSQLRLGNKLIWFGNGGSAADAQHLSTELVGKFRLDRDAIPSICLNTNVSLLTAIANDIGYENIFRRQVQAIGNRGDVCIGISTSGESKSVVLALEQARNMGLFTIAFTGQSPCTLWEFSDVVLPAPTTITCHIQECHITLGQFICMEIEKGLFGVN